MPVAGRSMLLKVTSATFARSMESASARRTFGSSKGGTAVLKAM